MTRSDQVSVTLPRELWEDVASLLAKIGHYRNPTEFVKTAIREHLATTLRNEQIRAEILAAPARVARRRSR